MLDAQPQLDSILRLPDEHQVKALWEDYYLNGEMERAKDTVAQLREYDALYDVLNSRGEDLLMQHAWLIRQVYRGSLLYLHQPLGQNIIQDAIRVAGARGWDVVEAEGLMYSGTNYYRNQMFGPAFDNMVRAYNRLKELGFDKYPHTMRHNASMAYAYFAFEDYPTAIRYLTEALACLNPGMSTGYLQVDNSAMTYLLINAVKEQQEMIEQLKHRIELLEQSGQ